MHNRKATSDGGLKWINMLRVDHLEHHGGDDQEDNPQRPLRKRGRIRFQELSLQVRKAEAERLNY